MKIANVTLQKPLNDLEKDAVTTGVVQWDGRLFEVADFTVLPAVPVEPPELHRSEIFPDGVEVPALPPIRLLEMSLAGPLSEGVDPTGWHRTPFNILGRIYLAAEMDYSSSPIGESYRIAFREIA